MKYIDTHIHATELTAKELKNLVENAKIEQFICVTTHESEWEKAAALYKEYPQKIIPAFGIHPWYLQGLQPGWESRLEQWLQKYPNAPVGEIGLDRLKNPEKHPQVEVFTQQLALAKKLNRPALIHAVKANDWLADLWEKMPAKFVFHAYSGKQEFLKSIISHHGYVSFSPSILKKPSRNKLICVAKPDKILLETDAPFQGEMDELFAIAAAIDEAFEKDMTNQLYQNTKEFLNA